MPPTSGFTSYHCHTTWSDGSGTLEEMIAAAAALGLDELGISDHFALTPYDDTNAHLWSMPRNGKRLQDYFQALQAAAASAPLPVRLGIEADFFPETWKELGDRLAALDLDFVIGSVHYVRRFPIDSSPEPWERLSQTEVDEVHRAYYHRIRQLAETGIFDIVGHFDLPKKFGFYPTNPPRAEIAAALDAIAASGMAMELNTAGWDKTCRDAYPSEEILGEAVRRRIPIILTADAHAPAQLTRHYERGAACLRRFGVTETRRWRRRRAATVAFPRLQPGRNRGGGAA